MSGYNSNHMIENIFIKDYFMQGKKITDRQLIGENEFVKNVSLE
jgi:hypothetical protein